MHGVVGARRRRGKANSCGALVLRLEYSGDLGDTLPWTAVSVPDASGTVGGVVFNVTPNGSLNNVTATIPAGAEAGGSLFGRLKGNE